MNQQSLHEVEPGRPPARVSASTGSLRMPKAAELQEAAEIAPLQEFGPRLARVVNRAAINHA